MHGLSRRLQPSPEGSGASRPSGERVCVWELERERVCVHGLSRALGVCVCTQTRTTAVDEKGGHFRSVDVSHNGLEKAEEELVRADRLAPRGVYTPVPDEGYVP